MRDSTGGLLRTLRRVRSTATPEDVADVVWLIRMQAADAPENDRVEPTLERPAPVTKESIPEAPAVEAQAPAPETEGTGEMQVTEPESEPEPTSSARSQHSELYLPAESSETPGSRSGRHLWVPAAPALVHGREMALALRPLTRRVPSRRRWRIDEIASADRIAQERLWLPVMRSAPERWLEVSLLVDLGPSMGIWRQTAEELKRLLRWTGAFRNIRVLGLRTDAAEPSLQVDAHRAGVGVSVNPRQLIEGTGRHLIVVLSDCVSSAWQGDGMARWLTLWGRREPVAIWQVLPDHQWAQTALADARPVRLSSPHAAAPNRFLRSQSKRGPFGGDRRSLAEPTVYYTPCPVVSLEPEALAGWGEMLTGVGWVPGFEWMPGTDSAEVPAGQELSAEELVKQFWMTASPGARRLAGCLAVSPVISLPILRLIRRTMLTSDQRVHEAEVLLGGLLEVNVEAADPDEVRYEFRPGVRERLLDSIPSADALRILTEEKLSRYIESHVGDVDSFRAFLEDPTSSQGAFLVEQSPFARVAAEALWRVGGNYARLVQRVPHVAQAAEVLDETAEQGFDDRKSDQGASKQQALLHEREDVSAFSLLSAPESRVGSGRSRGLILGFGGTGAHLLTFLKERAVLENGGVPEGLRFLFFDTIADWQPGETVKILGGAAEEKISSGTEEATSLDPSYEYFFLGDHDPDLQKHVDEHLTHGDNREHFPHLKDWLHAPWLSINFPKAALNFESGAAQQRQIGRFAMFQNAEAIVQQIRLDVKRIKRHAGHTGINVWLVASSAGGTGAGCLLDAAFLTRLATKGEKVSITALVLLPEIFSNIGGVSYAGAYSLIREIDRFQEQDFRFSDRFLEDSRGVSSRVAYDARGRVVSAVTGKLFDNLFYVGRPCHGDNARESFFTSVANAIDPFLDETSGPPLLEAALNESAAASSFGATRLYVPVETLASLFAWQEVRRYLEAASAPRLGDGLVKDLHYGAAEDRQRDARARVDNLLPLFKDVLGLAGKTDEELRRFARSLNPQSIVKEWYGFGGAAVTGMALTPAEDQLARLTYVNPYLSATSEEPDRLPAEELVTKTYQEHKNANLPKEKKIGSRDRFAAELEVVTQRFKNVDAADQSFEKGRRVVFDKLTRHLEGRIDELMLNELQQNPRFGRDPDALDQGTVMTRMFQELKEMLADHGPLARIDEMVSTFIAALDGEEERHQQEAVRAIKDLKEWTTSGFFGGNVNEPQVAAREASSTYVETYQRTRLLRDMQNLVRAVQARFRAWARALKAAFDALVVDISHSGYADTQKQLRRLRARLHRLAQNPTARISCSPDWDPQDNPDLEMMGYREKLRQECVGAEGGTLADLALSGSSWHLEVTPSGQPQVRLEVTLEGNRIEHGESTFGELHAALCQHFRKTIGERINARDIFDYLRFVGQPPHSVTAKKIGQMLNGAAEVLINAEAAESCRLIYMDPVDQDKRNLGDSILHKISESRGNIGVPNLPHSDPHSITLLKIKKPNPENIHNVVKCREDYIHWQQAIRSGDVAYDKKLARSQVFHAFRPELEAWFIERRQCDLGAKAIDENDHIPPRIVRLLEDPAMMQAFVHCVATGAVEKRNKSWVWHRTNDEDLRLTDPDREPSADLVRAAVVFVLQRRGGRRGGAVLINLEEARDSALAAAKAQGTTREDAIRDFIDNEMGDYLNSYYASESAAEFRPREAAEIAGLRMIFEFYADPRTSTSLSDRLI